MRKGAFFGLLPAWLVMALTLIIPVGIVIAVSLAERGAYGGFEWGFSFDAYKQILFTEGWSGELEFDPKYLVIIGRTIFLAGATMLICMVIALPVAYVISLCKPKTKTLLLYLVTLPFWVSMIVRVYAWQIILGNNGVLEKVWQFFGGGNLGTLLFTPGAMLTGMVYSYIPLMVLPVYATVEKLDGALLEASHDLYGNRWVTLRRIILPLCWPGLAAGAILVFVPALGTVLEPMILGGGKQMMMGTLIQTQFGGGRNWPFGSAVAVVLMVMAAIVLTINAQRARRNAMKGLS